MEQFDLIGFLSKSNELEIGCPKCNEFFSPKSANLFDIRAPYSPKTLRAFRKKEVQISSALKSIEKKKKAFAAKMVFVKQKEQKLNHRKKERPKIVKVTTKHINIGQIVEKILPASPRFKYSIADCRGLFDPIDYVAFNGFSSKGVVDNIAFIEVKTGNANLQKVQRQIKQTIEDGNLNVRTY